jgi:hypothetical protein
VAFNVSLTIATAHTRSHNDRDTRRDDLCNRVSRMLSASARSTDKEARDSCRPSHNCPSEGASDAKFQLILAALPPRHASNRGIHSSRRGDQRDRPTRPDTTGTHPPSINHD